MARKKVTADQMIELFNEAYLNQEGHDPANPFRPSPDGAHGKAMRGYSTVGPWTPQHSRALNKVTAEYELDDAA